MVQLDDWGYPMIADHPVPITLEGHAKRAVAACPTLALRLTDERDRKGPRHD
jgi:ferredoxin